MARQTKSWEVRVSWRRPDWKQGAFDTADYEVAADNEDDAKTIAWSAYCHEHNSDIESEKLIECVEMSRQYWVQS